MSSPHFGVLRRHSHLREFARKPELVSNTGGNLGNVPKLQMSANRQP